MTGRNIANNVWITLGDIDAPHDWEDSVMVSLINRAVKDLITRRPDARIDVSGEILTVTDIDSLTDTVSLIDYWQEPIVLLVTSMAYSMKGAGRENTKRAQLFMDNYLRGI